MFQSGNHALYMPSLAYTVGNVSFKTTNMLKNLFGKGFFKYVHIDTRMAYTEYALNTNKEFLHKNRPILAIKPVVVIDDDDIFLSNSLLTTNMYSLSFDKLNGGNFNFIPFFRDLENGNSAGYLLDRIRVQFGVFMDFDTVVEQMNMYRILLTMFHTEQQYPKKTGIEIHIPRALLQMISIDSGVPMVDDNGSVEKFLKFINAHTSKPVTYQMKPSSGHDEFFLYYPLNIEYTPSSFSMESVNKQGFASHSAAITFTLTAEFNSIQLYDYAPPRGKPMNLDAYNISIEDRKFDPANGKVMIPICTFDNLFEDRNENGWKFFTTRMYKVDKEPGQTEDILDISSLFTTTNIKDVIAYHNQHGIDNHIFFDIKVSGLDSWLKEGRDYYFDFEKLHLVTKKLNSKITYRFTIYINDEYLNDLLVRINPQEFMNEPKKSKDFKK